MPACVFALAAALKADFVHVDAEVSLLDAASLFQDRRIKFLPIIVPGSATVLGLISHVEILEVRRLKQAGVSIAGGRAGEGGSVTVK